MEDVLFVVGFFRSGTSLLYALLNQHPAIALTYEGNLFKFWPALRVGGLVKDWQQRLEFWNQTFSRHHLEFNQVAAARNRREAATALYRQYADRKRAAIIGAKAPAYHSCIQMVAEEFPDARFIILWRSPWEILRSIRVAGQTTRFFSAPAWTQYTAVGVKQMLQDCRDLRATGRNVFELNYQLLINDRSKTLTQICEFLNVPFDPKMLDLSGADVSTVPTGIHHAALRSGRILSPQPDPVDALSRKDRTILEKAFGNCENPPWSSGSIEQVAKDAARCGRQTRLSAGENVWRVRFESYDLLVRLIYAYAPFFLLNAWRGWRDRRFARERKG